VPGGAAPRGDQAAPIALYRRYRPATFAEVRGQEHVTEPLRQALRSGRIHHAYLFSGPRGCGKTSSARILARSLNCEQGPTPDPCGVCASCVALAPAGPGSIDVIEIDAASHGGVDDARDLRERAFYAPVSSRFKIYIVDEAHMVTREGFNALLKLVEEPPPHLKFVFATTEPEKVIATIRSRTHHYPFRLMPPAVLRGLLEGILASEGVAYEPSVLPVVIRAGAGSARDALSVLDQLLAGADESGLRYERAVALLGYTDDSLLDDVTDAFAAKDGAAVFHAVDRVVEGGHDPRRFAADLLDRFRDLIVLAAVPDAGQTGLLDVPADRLERMRQQSATAGLTELTRAAETISAGLVEMRGATSPRLLLELMCAQVLLPAQDAREQELTARLERLERRIGTGEAGDAAPRLTSPAAPESPAARTDRPARPAGRDADAGRGGRPQEVLAQGGPARPGQRPAAPAEPGNSGRTLSSPASASASGSSPPDRASPPAEHGAPAGTPSGSAPARPASSGSASARSASSGSASSGSAPASSGSAGSASAGSAPAGEAGSPAAGSAAAGTGPAALTERWDAILEEVKNERKVSWILLRGASVDSLSDGVLTLSFTREGDVKGFMAGGHERALSVVLERVLGINPQIRPIVGAANGPAAGTAETGGRGAAIRSGPGGDGWNDTGSGGGSASAGQYDRDTGAGGRGGSGQHTQDRGQGQSGQQGASPGPDHNGRRDGDPGPARGGGGAGAESAGGDGPGAASGAAHDGLGEGDRRAGASQSGPGSGSARGRAHSSESRAHEQQARTGHEAGRAGRQHADVQAGDDADADALIGADLIERELGGRVIEESGGA
jgi:DNA polymerase-3 subunit gamma/tau